MLYTITLRSTFMYFNQKVVMGLGCLDHRAKLGKDCRHPGKQLICPSNQLFQLYDGQAGIGSALLEFCSCFS